MEFFAVVRILGDLSETGKWMDGKQETGPNYVDIAITREEAERMVKFLTVCFEKDVKH